PVFQGNRLPGVSGVQEAFHLAWAYGVWPGKSATTFARNDNAAYHLALMAHEAGVSVSKIFDNRIDPQSRYAVFAKASGIRLESGLRPASVQSGITRAPLVMALEFGWEGGVSQRQLIETA